MMKRKNLAYKLSDEEFKKIVEVSSSKADLMRKLGYHTTAGNSFNVIKRRIMELNLIFPDPQKPVKRLHELENKDFFIKNSKRGGTKTRNRICKYHLKKYECAICGNKGFWNGKKLVLQIDHINGDHFDNRLENLRFLCPNCHSQTDNFAGKNIKDKNNKI